MVFLGLFGLTIALFASFLVLTLYEARGGFRLFAQWRARLDARISRIAFILTNVDFESFLREQVQILALQVAHDVAHYALLFIRAIERLLTRVVKYFRVTHDIPPVRSESTRPFVKAMSDFKQQLQGAHPTLSTTK